MTINLDNIEDLIFNNKQIKSQLIEFTDQFNQWYFGKMYNFKDLIIKSKLDVLNNLNEKHLIFLKNYFEEDVFIIKNSVNSVSNYEDDVECLVFNISNESKPNIAIYRKNNNLKATFWK